ncbi:MAG TPA: DUF805 domain-containing protein [Burkholderiaceae bacterium]|jgi:uncharacterized membrane protein YhaH (DUF805 family)
MILSSELSTRGRLSRPGFWLRHLIAVPIALWVVVAAGHSPGAPYDVPLALVLVAMLVSIWGRRLHDRGHSAWWLLAVVVPVLGALALIVEAGLRGTAPRGDRFGPPTGLRAHYLSVSGAPTQATQP